MDLSQFFPALPQYGRPIAPNVGPGVPQNPMTLGQMPNPLLPPQQRGQFINMPQQPQSRGGMFGGGKPTINIGGAIAGYLAGSGNRAGIPLLEASNERNRMALEEQIYEHRQNLEMQRQMAMLPLQAQLKLMYPDGDFAQSLYASGIMPGTPEWTKAMQTRTQNELDPAVVTPQGMMLRSQIAGAMNAKPLTDADIAAMDGKGGQTAPAQSGGFLGAPFAPVGPYNRRY